MESAGCNPGTLKLIVWTHGDFDHSGNCAYLREKYGAKIAMHSDDKGMVEHGDLFYNRNANFLTKILGKMILFFLRTGLKRMPDSHQIIYVEDGYDFSEFGFDAEVIHFLGHSKGSIGVLTSTGDLYCGDLLENTKKPASNSIIADKEAFNSSVEKLKQLKISRAYPGHGKPFPMELFMKNQTRS
jgi:hydroxyacylglutathione hydrolase